MEKKRAMVRKWGTSLGVILPKELVEKEKLREGLEISIAVTPENATTVAKLFELSEEMRLPRLKLSTEKIMKEVDAQLWPE